MSPILVTAIQGVDFTEVTDCSPMHPRKTIEDVFGVPAFGPAMFYTCPGGLRFALSDGGAALDEALTALHKATVICRDVFSGADMLTVCLGCHAPDGRFEMRTMLRELARAGLSIPRARDVRVDYLSGGEESMGDRGDRWLSVVFTLPATKLQNLLWCALAYDLNVRPRPGCRIHIINLAQRLIVHPYDDRGMDVVGPNSALLGQLYRKHNAWLLDYDRAQMDATFALPPGDR
ncbi:MAG: DUF3885 domain-containing protein [Telluria sp.]